MTKNWLDTPMTVTTSVVNLLMFPILIVMWLLGLIIGNFVRPFMVGFKS